MKFMKGMNNMYWKEYNVDISKTRRTSKYQRPINPQNLRRIIRDYDDSKVNQLILSYRTNGTYEVIDGAHTIEATKVVRGERWKLSARVYYDCTDQEEAALFTSFNSDNKPLTYGDKLRGRYYSNEPKAVKYIDFLLKSGIKWSYTDRQHGDAFVAHAAGETALRRFGDIDFERALYVFSQTVKVHRNDGRYLGGFGRIIHGTPNVDLQRLIDVVNVTPKDDIDRIAKSYSNSLYTGDTADRKFAKAIAELYNKGLRKNRIDISKL